MGYAEPRGSGSSRYYLARFSDGRGKWPTVKGDDGRAIRYTKRRDAEKAANDKEAEVRGSRYHDPNRGQITFGAWASAWYAAQDLAPSTMQNYKHHLEEHLLPFFEDFSLNDIAERPRLIDDWEKAEKAAGYMPSSIKTWRGTLHLVLADAADGREVDKILETSARQPLIEFNPATKRRGRGRRAGRRGAGRSPEKVTTGPLGALLVAERAAILAGRDDEFVAVVTDVYTGMRWAELVGLETRYARLGSIQVEWQLWEDDKGILHRLPPKDDSYRNIDLPPFLSGLISDHITRTAPRPCECHGNSYVFTGRAARTVGVNVKEVARRAGVSAGTVSNVLNHPERVSDGTRARVEAAMREVPLPGAAGSGAAHWRRSGFSDWTFAPAASGWYPKKGSQKRRPVPLHAEPWPGAPVRGRNAQGRAAACWLPIAEGLTPHGLRHSHKTLMDELRTPPKFKDERMGHLDGSVQARYSHVTDAMRTELLDGLTRRWEESLDARAELCPTSPVPVLDELLKARQKRKVGRPGHDRPTEFPQNGVTVLHSRPRKRA